MRVTSDDDIKSFQQRVYHRTDHLGNKVMGVQGTGPNMVMSRTRRCQNCQFWDQGERYDRRVKERVDEDRTLLAQAGKTQKEVEVQLVRLGRTMSTGEWGMCTHRDPPEEIGHFTHLKYRCSGWDGRVIVTPGEHDMDVSEAMAINHIKKT